MKNLYCVKPKIKGAENLKNYIFTDDKDAADQISENLNNSFTSMSYEVEEIETYSDYREYLFYES
jgi:hypothetical protein